MIFFCLSSACFLQKQKLVSNHTNIALMQTKSSSKRNCWMINGFIVFGVFSQRHEGLSLIDYLACLFLLSVDVTVTLILPCSMILSLQAVESRLQYSVLIVLEVTRANHMMRCGYSDKDAISNLCPHNAILGLRILWIMGVQLQDFLMIVLDGRVHEVLLEAMTLDDVAHCL